MKCEACVRMMDELVEGELEGNLTREAAVHIAACTSCSQVYRSLRHEQELYGQYLMDVEATPALWANLRVEIDKEKANRASHPLRRLQLGLATALGSLNFTPLQASALVLITIGLVVGIWMRRTGGDISTNPPRNAAVSDQQSSSEVASNSTPRRPDDLDRTSAVGTADRTIQPASTESGDRGAGLRAKATRRATRSLTVKNETSSSVPTVDEVARQAEQQYLAAIEILSRDIESRGALISPTAVSQLQTALAEVDRTIAATRKAVREQPRDPAAIQYMTSAYEKKVELLRETVSR